LISLDSVLDSLSSVAVLLVGASCVQPSDGIVRDVIFRIDRQNVVEVGDGLVVFAHFQPDYSAMTVDDGTLGTDHQGLIEVGDGFAVLTIFAPCRPAIAVNDGILGIELKGFVVVGNGLVVLALFLPDAAPIVVGTE
jgi:hypothetical protein